MRIKLRIITKEGKHKGKVLIHTNSYHGSWMLSDFREHKNDIDEYSSTQEGYHCLNGAVPEHTSEFFYTGQVEIKEFSDEVTDVQAPSTVELIREVQEKIVEVPAKLTVLEQKALTLGLRMLEESKAAIEEKKSRAVTIELVSKAGRARRDVYEGFADLLTEAGINEKDAKEALGMSMDEEDGLPHCNECEAEEFLNPETGLCLDCQLEMEEESEEDSEDDDTECPECGEELDEDGDCENGCTHASFPRDDED